MSINVKIQMINVKKRVVLVNAVLILSNSLILDVTALAENQADSEVKGWSVVQQKNKVVKEKAIIDQNIYGNLLINSRMERKGNALPGWKPTLNQKETAFKYGGNKLIFDGSNNENYIYWENGIVIFAANYTNRIPRLISEKVDVLRNRTYEGVLNVEHPGYNYAYTLYNENKKIAGDSLATTIKGKRVFTYKPSMNEKIYINLLANNGNNEPALKIVSSDTKLALKYAEHWKQVDALFTSLDCTELAPGVTKDAINQAKAMVNSIVDNNDVTEMNEVLAKADTLYEEKLADELNSLLNNGQLTSRTSQENFDNLQELINQLPDSQKKQELQNKLDQEQKFLGTRLFTKELMITGKPTNTLNAGILMGNGHDRQDLGIQLEKNATIKIKQINPNFKENLSLRLLTNDSHTETYTTFSDNEVKVTAKDLSVPFIDTPYI